MAFLKISSNLSGFAPGRFQKSVRIGTKAPLPLPGVLLATALARF